MIIILESINLVRILLYFGIGLTFAFLAYAYHFGFKNVRPSPIIKAISRMFCWLAVIFFYLSFIPVLKLTSPMAYNIATNVITFILIPVLWSAYRFFIESFSVQKVEK